MLRIVTLGDGGVNDIAGRAIVVHAGEDDLGKGGDDESKKTGNAGARKLYDKSTYNGFIINWILHQIIMYFYKSEAGSWLNNDNPHTPPSPHLLLTN